MLSSLPRRSFLASLAAAAPLAALPLNRFPLGVTTDEIDEDVSVAAAFLQEFHLGLAEVRSVYGKYNTAQPLEKITEIRATLAARGVKTSVLGTAFFRGLVPATDGEILDKEWALLDAAAERAKILGTGVLRTFAFTTRPGEAPQESAWPRIAELLTEASRRAKKLGLRLAVENLAGSYVSNGAQAARMLAQVKEDALGLTWDPNNAASVGETPFPGPFEKLDKARIFHVHVRDYRHTAEGKVEWCPVGAGEFDNTAHIRALLKSGYKGAFSLETHYKHPDGKAAATRVSLAGLLKVVDQL